MEQDSLKKELKRHNICLMEMVNEPYRQLAYAMGAISA